MQKEVYLSFDIIDAWSDGEGGWTYNRIIDGVFKTMMPVNWDCRMLFKKLRENGWVIPAGKYTIDYTFAYDGTYEIVDRKTREPVYAIHEFN